MFSTVVLTLLFAFAPAGKDRAWQDGMLAGVTKHDPRAQVLEQQVQTGTGDKEIRYTITYEYTIQTSEKFYVADIDAYNMGAPVSVPPIDLGGDNHLKFAVEKQTLYVKDKLGKEHKLAVVKQGLGQAKSPDR